MVSGNHAGAQPGTCEPRKGAGEVRMIDITTARMRSQCLTSDLLATPEEIVHRLGAVQCQDYGPGKWSIAQRSNDVRQAVMDQACTAGTILRTHVLRPTWHFVLPADIRWMLELTAPRVLALSASYYRNQELMEPCSSSAPQYSPALSSMDTTSPVERSRACWNGRASRRSPCASASS